jgi:thiol-disulfide isomerase/thioredoxin
LTGTSAAWRACLAVFGALLLNGCATEHQAQSVALRPVNFNQWKRELAALKGNIVVVDVWATWCLPCLDRFPHIVDLSNRYKNRGVVVVSMSVDDRDDKRAAEVARHFLSQQHATFRNYLMDENILDAFEKLGVQGIPAVFLYDRAGRQRYFLNADDPNHQFSPKDIDNAVAVLVSESTKTPE